MPNDISELANLAHKIDATELPQSSTGIEILPVSHDQFQARWNLSNEALDAGRNIASHSAEEAHLVLRAFSLPADAHNGELSGVWHDFNIDGVDNSGYFNLPGPAEKINASLGLINKDGRFSPLLRGDSIALPAAPASTQPAPAQSSAAESEIEEEPSSDACVPFKRTAIIETLNEAEICARLAHIDGLPEEFKTPALQYLAAAEAAAEEEPAASVAETAGPIRDAFKTLPDTPTFDEGAVLETVRHNMAAQPDPEIEESVEQPPIHNTEQESDQADAQCGASELLASQWEEIWSNKAPIEVRAEFILTGKIASGMKLLLGNEIVAPAPGGFFTWKRPLDNFGQAWPLLQAALSTPVVSAGPSLEFFQDVAPSERMLELHAALEIEGQVTDPDYIERLPADLSPDSNGQFKLSRMLPDGAVILPGLSLIASN